MISAKAILPKIPKPGDPVTKKQAEFVAEEIRKTFLESTSTWNRKPVFKKEIKITKKQVKISVYTTSKIYGYVTFGTKPHTIRPKTPGGMLIYPRDYKSKTTLGSRKARSGGHSGPIVFRKSVQHPGFEGRMLHKKIADYWRKKFPPTFKSTFFNNMKLYGIIRS